VHRARPIGFVIALASFVGVSAAPREQPALEPVTDPDAYAVYAAALSWAWAQQSEPLLIQQETEAADVREPSCLTKVREQPGWPEVVSAFIDANARPAKRLEPMLPLDRIYFFISHAELRADDERLALKYPGLWQSRPESIEYVAVSRVGFNAAKTHAIVYTRARSRRDDSHFFVLRDGQWLTPSFPFGCVGGVA
jgi:hypothetical protein